MLFIPSLTTTAYSNWKDKVLEIKKLNIKEISLFPTSLNYEQRQELYGLLENIPITCPHIHLRHDMTKEEIKYLQRRFQPRIFNIHPNMFNSEWDFIKDKTYVENAGKQLEDKDIENFPGICLDFSHLEDERRLFPEYYQKLIEMINKYKIGCGHISGIGKTLGDRYQRNPNRFEEHFSQDLTEFDYLKRYKSLFPEIICIELENTLEEQLKIIEYIKRL